MRVINSLIAHLIEDTIETKIGDFYFFKNFIIAEFKEGSHVSYIEFEDVMELGEAKYQLRPVGFISNRIHSYSINLIDMFENSVILISVKAYAVVYYNEKTLNILGLEDKFFSIPRPRFDNLIEATDWVNSELQKYK